MTVSNTPYRNHLLENLKQRNSRETEAYFKLIKLSKYKNKSHKILI